MSAPDGTPHRAGGAAASAGRRPAVSVIVCTHNRAALLPGVVEALVGQTLPPDDLEIVIVDNASTDRTPQVLAELAERWPGRLRVVEEPVPGLGRARNRGLEEARGTFIAFTDDDAVPAPDWAAGLAGALRARTDAAAAVGTVVPRFVDPRPHWLHDRLLSALSIWVAPRPGITDLREDEIPVGANMAFRREAFERFGVFSPALGNTGDRLWGAEETELLRRVRSGAAVVVVADARVEHLLDAARMSKRHLLRLARERGLGGRTMGGVPIKAWLRQWMMLAVLLPLLGAAVVANRRGWAFWCRFKILQKWSFLVG